MEQYHFGPVLVEAVSGAARGGLIYCFWWRPAGRKNHDFSFVRSILAKSMNLLAFP